MLVHGDKFSCFLHTKIIPIRQCQWIIVPAQSWLVVCWVWYYMASASLFLRTGHALVVRPLGIIAGGGVALRLWGPRSLLGSSTWSNSLITGYYPVASARRHVLMFPVYKNNIYAPVPGVSSPVENCACSESARYFAGCVILYGKCQSDFDGMVMS